MSGSVAQWASSRSGGGGAYALVLLDRSDRCALSTLVAMRVKDARGKTIARHTGIAVAMPIAVAIWVDFLSICPTDRSLPLALSLDFGQGVVATVEMPGAFFVSCADGSSRAFVDGVVEASAELPGAGGTCAARDFVAGTATTTYGSSSLFSRVLQIAQPILNTGTDCVLQVPGIVAAASATGPYQPVSVGAAEPESAITIRAGASATIRVRASFPSDPADDASGGQICQQALQDVTRLQFPMATGSILMQWTPAVPEVCSAPTMMSVAVATDR